jgi:hypothetical protein
LVALSRPARPVSRPALTLLLAFAMGVASVVTFIIGALAPFMVASSGSPGRRSGCWRPG